ncbi:TRAP transporter substrate-binding protein [Aliiroseovarius crassostreae]|uniref:TRAP transporter substrate-binding protein n=1 Tax=Aliiroseovarius crassostreae TaxID=154981 RepID=UPI003C7E9C24
MKLTKMMFAGLAGIAMSAAAASAADFTFKYGQSQPESSSRGQSMVFFEKEVEARSGGRIDVQNFFDNVLGTEQEMYDQMATGLIQGTRGGFFANANPQFNIFLLPFLTSGWDEMRCLVGSEFTDSVEAAAGNGVHVPATGISQGFRMYTNNVRPINEVGDLAGLKIREPQTDFFISVAETMGSNIVPMAFSELYQAFKTGVIDGQHNPPANIWNAKFYEVQKYLSVTNHMTGPDPLLINADWYNGLPEDLQQIVNEVADEALKLNDELAQAAEFDLLDKLGAEMEINTLSPEGIATFVSAVQPVYQAGIDAGHYSQADLDAAMAAAKSCN